jgi:hypothetical protein
LNFLYHKKRSAKDRTAAEKKMLLKQPAAGGESRKRDSFLCIIEVAECTELPIDVVEELAESK